MANDTLKKNRIKPKSDLNHRLVLLHVNCEQNIFFNKHGVFN